MRSGTRYVGVFVALALAATVALGVRLVVGPTGASSDSTKSEALLVGDSVLNGLAQPYSAAGRAALAARHTYILDAAGCRRLVTTSCRIPPAAAPTNALTEVRRWAGAYTDALVIAAGYDDPTDGPNGIAAAVATMVAEAHRQGVERVIWLTYREAGSPANLRRFRASNAVLHGLLATTPELRLADWAVRSASLSTKWFSADGIHLGPQSAAAMADLIGDALDELHAVPTRCTAGTWTGDVAAADPAAAPTQATGGVQLLGAPVRLVDTRELAGPLGAGRVLRLPVAGAKGVPPDAMGVVVSVTAVDPCADTFVTAFACGSGPPTASTLNALAGTIVTNSAFVRLGGGALCVTSLQGTDLVVDVSGWVGPGGSATRAVTPVRLVDTRPGEAELVPVAQQRLAGGHGLDVDLSGLADLGPSDTAVTVDVAAVGPAASGFLSVLPGPCSTLRLPPGTSDLTVTAGRDSAASSTVGLIDRRFCIYASVTTDVVIDLQAVHGATGGATTVVDPVRLLDTRTTQRLTAGASVPVDLTPVGVGIGVNGALAAIVDLTAVGPSGRGFLTLSPCGIPVPTTSNLNVAAGDVLANRAIVSTAGSTRFCVSSSVDTDVVVDLQGYVMPA